MEKALFVAESQHGVQEASQQHTVQGGSMELRKLPVYPTVAPGSADDDSLVDSTPACGLDSLGGEQRDFLHRTCLRPNFLLKTQLMLSFGVVGAIAITFVVSTCIVLAWVCGERAQTTTIESFMDLLTALGVQAVRYRSESMTAVLLPVELVRILHEATRDRFAGYPDVLGYEEDRTVPFWDVESQTNKYPIAFPLAPLTWQLGPLVNHQNYAEHVQQSRWNWYNSSVLAGVSTATASYFMQGVCNPETTDPTEFDYYPNCTDANNNITTGGVVAPSKTNEHIYRKASDLIPIFKALYEFHEEVLYMGVYFANSGSGSYIRFPHLKDNSSRIHYKSVGCDWMLQPNPLDPSRTIGTPDQITTCKPKGTLVPVSQTNMLETRVCRDQALNPGKVRISDILLSPSMHQGSLLVSGMAVYDRISKDFIGCILVALNGQFVQEMLVESNPTQRSHSTIVKFDDTGTVLASTAWDMLSAETTVSIDQLDVGVDSEAYKKAHRLVDFDSVWNSEEVKAEYEANAIISDDYVIATYPIPPIPDTYDPDYRPEFLTFISIPRLHVQEQADSFVEEVDDIVVDIILRSVIVGCAGLLVCTMIIVVVSRTLTLPLNSMNSVATAIVKRSGETSDEEQKIKLNMNQHKFTCQFRTELTDVVKEFENMVSRFSGSAMAKAMNVLPLETLNMFPMKMQCQDLYKKRQKSDFPYTATFPTIHRGPTGSLLHVGSNINRISPTASSTLSHNEVSKPANRFQSPLFFWIVTLIAAPLVLTTITVAALSLVTFATQLPEFIDKAKTEYLEVGLMGLSIISNLRAEVLNGATLVPLQDLHLTTRYAGWLFFDGIKQSDSYTDLVSFSEECKLAEVVDACSAAQSYVCDCEWTNEGTPCQNFSSGDSRYLQRLFFSSQLDGNDSNGNRNVSTFPDTAVSPSTTQWYDDHRTIPGFEKGSSAGGYETSYDRLRVLSALPIITLINAGRRNPTTLGLNVGMEADGLYVGHVSGCRMSTASAFFPFFEMDELAERLRPELCPVGKFGYDPRCRGWYDTGRDRFLNRNDTVFVTAPYLFANEDREVYAQSGTSPLFDPHTGEHVGQTLVDFSNAILSKFDTLEIRSSFMDNVSPVLIIIEPMRGGGDTVIGPGFSEREEAVPIQSLLAPRDWNCTDYGGVGCVDQSILNDIVRSMKEGFRGRRNFTRTSPDGGLERLYILSSPVRVFDLTPVDSSDFSRGVRGADIWVYSHALVVTEDEVRLPFVELETDLKRLALAVLVALSGVIIFVTVLMLFVSGRVAISITTRMVYLLDLIKCINKVNIDDDHPEAKQNYGAKEVQNVADTMEMLYKVVRGANDSFYSGNIESAYLVMNDALRLFKRMDNKKAIGVACNNLGNIMLTIYRTMKSTGEDVVCDLGERDIIQKGIEYFEQSIKLGEKAYDDFYEAQGWSPDCLYFMQHLSNRYFNRGMFLLTVKDGHEKPEELEEIGLRDIQIAKDMDVEIVDQGTEVGWEVNTPEKMFNVALSRARGHLHLLAMGYPDNWDTEELLEETYKMVQREIGKPGSSLFKDFSPTGCLQQIEAEIIRYKLLQKDVELAAGIGVRMLFEDEFVFPYAQEQAVEALVGYVLAQDNYSDEVKERLESYKNGLRKLNMEVMPPEQSQLPSFCRAPSSRKHLREFIKESSRRDITMEIF